MNIPMIRRRLPDGTHGPLEPLFPDDVAIDPNTLMLLEAIAGQQEQIEQLSAKIEQLEGGAK